MSICSEIRLKELRVRASFKFLNEAGISHNQSKFWFLDSIMKRLKDSNEMAIENTIPVVPRNPPTCTSNK